MALELRPLRPDDELEFRRACHAMEPGDFEFVFGFGDDRDFGEYLKRLELNRAGIDLDADHVPSTYLVAIVDGAIVGRVSMRHELNEHLLQEGGHIGYGVLPAMRGRGYATEMLRQALVEARHLGIGRALLTCDESNAASIRVIESCGGNNQTSAADKAAGIRRYWITTTLTPDKRHGRSDGGPRSDTASSRGSFRYGAPSCSRSFSSVVLAGQNRPTNSATGERTLSMRLAMPSSMLDATSSR